MPDNTRLKSAPVPPGWELTNALYRHLTQCPQCRVCLAGRALLDGVLSQSGGAKFIWRTRSPRTPAGHCRNGHAMVPGNYYIRPNGQRICKLCIKARLAKG